ncbi:hypothetical protein ACWEN6_10300 [Sphaerisporangium sp. NPDC004334]
MGEAACEFSWVPQRQAAGRFPLLVSELLASGRDSARAHAAASDPGIGGLLDRPLATLSGGQLQKQDHAEINSYTTPLDVIAH